ncbi:unnamed protein product [Caenorhabditis nigoni]
MDPPKEAKMLSSLSSICVLEYLKFDKRQYLVFQIPGFQNVEKSLPLHLNDLAISADRIRLDGSEYYLKDRLRRTQNFDPTFEKLVFDLIGNRPMISTMKLEFRISAKSDSWIYQFIVSLNIKADAFETCGFSLSYEELDRISNILGPKPLKEFSTKLDNYEILAHPIVRNSEKLVLYSGRVNFNHNEVNHSNIHLKNYKNQYTLMNYLNEWIEYDNDIGMEFSGDIELEKNSFWALLEVKIWIKEMMYLKKIGSDGRRVRADERFPNTIYSISMPRTNDPDTEIQISLIKNGPKLQIHQKVQISGTAIPELFDSMF